MNRSLQLRVWNRIRGWMHMVMWVGAAVVRLRCAMRF